MTDGTGFQNSGDSHTEIIDSALYESKDSVEYCRGLIAASTYVCATKAREVHILRLRNAFERALIAPKLRYSLRVLSLMREVQELKGGYWFPTPVRAVPAGDNSILVSISPTNELRRHFSEVSRAGYIRVVPKVLAQKLPRQELDDWLGLAIGDSGIWVTAQFKEARANMGVTIDPGNVQFFTLLYKSSISSKATYPAWVESASDAVSSVDGTVLFRSRIGSESFRYCLGRLKAGRLAAEANNLIDIARIQYAFAAMVNRPLTVDVVVNGVTSVIHLPAGLPRPERQLLLALGTRDMQLRGRAYSVRTADFNLLILSRLRKLGCDIRIAHV